MKLKGYKTLEEIAQNSSITRQAAHVRMLNGHIVKIGDEYFYNSDLMHHLIDARKFLK